MSDKAAYPLKSNDALFKHGAPGATNLPALLQDLSGKLRTMEIDAQAASGDIFVMLATAVDAVSGQLTTDKPIVHPQLQKIAETLIYLQRHYQVSRKPSDYRQ